MSILITAIATLVVTILAALLLDLVRNIKPKIVYKVREALPIKLESKQIGAYLINIANASKKQIKDITVYIEAQNTLLKNGGISCPQGFNYEIKINENNITIVIPFIKDNEEISITVIAESQFVIPKRPDVAIRSPHQINITELTGNRYKGNRFFPKIFVPIITSITATLMAITLISKTITRDTRDVLVYSATISDLPELVKIYVNANSLRYINQGDLAFSLAKTCNNKDEITKYKKFIETTLSYSPAMADESRSNLYYELAKINMLLNDTNMAKENVKMAIKINLAHIEEIIKYDDIIRQIVYKEGMMIKTKSP